jgi:hypothetical protein
MALGLAKQVCMDACNGLSGIAGAVDKGNIGIWVAKQNTDKFSAGVACAAYDADIYVVCCHAISNL